MREKEVIIKICNNCKYLEDCVKKGAVIDAAKPDSDAPRYIPGLGSNCKRMDPLLKAYGAGYDEGLNDAWDAARKIACDGSVGGLSIGQLRECFGTAVTVDIFKKHTIKQALEKIKKFEETMKLERGDYVLYMCGGKEHTGILLYEHETYYWVLFDNEPCPQRIVRYRDTPILTKLDKHIDLDGLFNGLEDKE